MAAVLHWADYLVLAAFLVISLGIGVYHSLTGGKQKTTEEFIMANRSLNVIPTSLSLLVSFLSAIAILGFSAEIYSYGTQYIIWNNVSYALGVLLSALIFVPWFYPLKLVSVNEYFYRRFNSRIIQALAGAMSMLTAMFGMGVTMYAPAAALEAVTGFSAYITVPLMSVICIIYTTLGGMRAVIWTDVFQFFIILGGMLAIFIKGLITVGGFENTFTLMSQQDRVFWIIWTLDPRVRHTVWEFMIGNTMIWTFVYGISQASAQRYNATRSLSKARLSLLLNIPIYWLLCFMMCSMGMIITAYYTIIACDPLANRQISNPNQLLPLFVTSIFSTSYGFSDLFIATLYGATLSSISTSLSGVSASFWKDILKWKFDHIKESSKALIQRILVASFGIIATGFAFFAANVPGTVMQVSLSLSGCIAGPYCGLFFLGGMSRLANWKGAIVGAICGLTISIWLSLGAILSKIFTPPLHPLPVSGCTSDNSTGYTSTEPVLWNSETTAWNDLSTQAAITSERQQYQGLQNFYAVSYMWYMTVGIVSTVLSGAIASLIFKLTCKGEHEIFDDNLIIPWRRLCTFGNMEKNEEQANNSKKHTPVSLVNVYKIDEADNKGTQQNGKPKLSDLQDSNTFSHI